MKAKVTLFLKNIITHHLVSEKKAYFDMRKQSITYLPDAKMFQ